MHWKYFLDAIGFGIRFMNSTPQGRLRMMRDDSCMPLVPELDMNDFVFEVEVHKPELGEYQSVDDIEINPAIRAIRDLKYGACYPLSTDAVMNDYPLEFASQESGAFALSERDLPRSLYELKQKHSEKYEEFQSIVCRLFPEIVDIDVVSSQLQPEQKQQLEDQTQRLQETVVDDDDPIPYRIRDEVHRIYITSSYLNQPVSVYRMSDGTRRVILRWADG